MESTVVISTDQPINKVVSIKGCVHGRLIDDVLTRGGKRTGKVCCLECGAIFDDPYQDLK